MSTHDIPMKEYHIYIEDNVQIGMRAMIMPGVRLGKGCVVGANSIVTKDVPPYTIVAGQPAKVIKEVPEKFDIMIILLNYWEKKSFKLKLQIISLLSNSGVKYVIKYITAPKLESLYPINWSINL